LLEDLALRDNVESAPYKHVLSAKGEDEVEGRKKFLEIA
jgi:hypothetical protein